MAESVRDQIRKAKEDAAKARNDGRDEDAARHSARADELVRTLMAEGTTR